MATLWTTCPQRGGGQMHQLSQSQMMAAGYIPCSAYLKSWEHSGCQSRRRNQSRKDGGENRSPKIPILNQNVHGDGRGKMQASLPEVYSPTDWETCNSSEHGIKKLLEQHQYSALTITLTGDYKVIYRRFLERESRPDRHRGHVVNDCYTEKKKDKPKTP